MAKAASIKIKLVSTADTGFYYVTKKNSRTMTEKLKMKKYDPIAKKPAELDEGKNTESTKAGNQKRRAPISAPFSFSLSVFVGKKVAGRERCHEEATRIAPRPAEPHGLRRCGGPEQPVGISLGRIANVNPTKTR